MPDLQSLWPTLSPRQRDALVAKAKGWVPYGGRQIAVPESDLWEVEQRHVRCAWSASIVDDAGAEHFSSDWRHAGPLLEEMLAANCEIRMQPAMDRSICVDGDEGTLLVAQKTAATIVATGEGWPDRIALAFCLWKGIKP